MHPCVLLHQMSVHKQLNEDLDFSVRADPDFTDGFIQNSSVHAWDDMSFSPLTMKGVRGAYCRRQCLHLAS